MSNNEHIDKLFRERLREREFQATEADWQAALDVIERNEGGGNGVGRWVVAALAVVGVATLLFFTNNSGNEEVSETKKVSEQRDPVLEKALDQEPTIGSTVEQAAVNEAALDEPHGTTSKDKTAPTSVSDDFPAASFESVGGPNMTDNGPNNEKVQRSEQGAEDEDLAEVVLEATNNSLDPSNKQTAAVAEKTLDGSISLTVGDRPGTDNNVSNRDGTPGQEVDPNPTRYDQNNEQHAPEGGQEDPAVEDNNDQLPQQNSSADATAGPSSTGAVEGHPAVQDVVIEGTVNGSSQNGPDTPINPLADDTADQGKVGEADVLENDRPEPQAPNSEDLTEVEGSTIKVPARPLEADPTHQDVTSGTVITNEATTTLSGDTLPDQVIMNLTDTVADRDSTRAATDSILSSMSLTSNTDHAEFAKDLLIHAHGGILFSTGNNAGDANVASLVNENSSAKPMGYYGVDLMLPFGGFSIGGGFHMTQYGEQSSIPGETFTNESYTVTDSTVYTHFIDSLWNPSTQTWFIFQQWDTIQVYDTTTTVTTTMRPASNTVNRFNYMEIPIMGGKLWDKGRWLIGTQAGVTVGILTGKQGRYPNAELTGYTEASEQKFSSVSLGYILRPMVHYKLNDHFTIGLEPSIRGHLTSIMQDGPLSGRRYLSYGVGVGLIYRLGKKAQAEQR